ncbi:hypothetical protein BaRGS_00028022 [Batillaria attramentaria]|uniref:Uncharacterized protein n=1 Tax=Batillaria attramentaria TaxID=370345 RepID=A0ABD0K163_9CAEN
MHHRSTPSLLTSLVYARDAKTEECVDWKRIEPDLHLGPTPRQRSSSFGQPIFTCQFVCAHARLAAVALLRGEVARCSKWSWVLSGDALLFSVIRMLVDAGRGGEKRS